MKVLLDTHALLWWWAADRRIDPVRAIIADAENEIFVSAASIWEIATKHRIGKLPEAGRLLPDMDVHVRRSRFNELPISFAHAELAGSMTSDHRDPFDRMLIAQAKLEAMPIASSDRIFESFGVPIIWDSRITRA
jgi:PIN domain nuclease of toxin-antitoxin system